MQGRGRQLTVAGNVDRKGEVHNVLFFWFAYEVEEVLTESILLLLMNCHGFSPRVLGGGRLQVKCDVTFTQPRIFGGAAAATAQAAPSSQSKETVKTMTLNQ
eukprot:3037334-Amphidinium_carterae.1